MDSDLTAAERAFLSHLQVIADELRDTAHIIGAGYLTAHLPIADNGLLVFTVDYDDVTVTGPGFEWCLPGAP